MLFSNFGIAPSAVAGCIFGLALMLLLDGIIVAQSESDVANHVSFTMLIPAFISILGFLLMISISPVEVKNDVPRAKAVLFIGWIICISSAVGALVICKTKFTGLQERTRAVPGVSLVIFTSFVPLSGAILWWGRMSSIDEY